MGGRYFEFSAEFRRDRCQQCGECLHHCPVLGLPIEQAREEMQRMAAGEPSFVIDRCTGCMDCNSFCPNGANPYTLVMHRWHERYLREGIPVRGRYVLPYQEPNHYTVGIEHLPPEERALIDRWERNWREPGGYDTMMYAGCNCLFQPYLLDSRVFDGLPIFGSPDICCAEPLYRMGCWEAARAAALHVKAEFERMGLKRVIAPCFGGYSMFRHVYGEVLGVPLDIEVVSVLDWVLGRLERGDIELKPLGKRAVLHDNCWPQSEGDHHHEAVRKLLDILGVEVVEPTHARADTICCGMCAAATRFSFVDVLKAAKRRVREFAEADADFAVDYCGGCNWLMTMAQTLSLRKPSKPILHVLEVLQMATGEWRGERTPERARTVLRHMAVPIARSYVSSERFWIKDILGQPVEPFELDNGEGKRG